MRIPESTFELSSRKIRNAFPSNLSLDVEAVINYLSNKNLSVSLYNHNVILDGESLKIPQRVYFDKPNEFFDAGLTELQQTILYCIYLRHHDGYVRQACLELLKGKDGYFVIPYIFQLLGEYVKEILVVADNLINETNMPMYRRFKSENHVYWNQTECRMVSYWNEYYRRTDKRLKDYIGYKLFQRLK